MDIKKKKKWKRGLALFYHLIRKKRMQTDCYWYTNSKVVWQVLQLWREWLLMFMYMELTWSQETEEVQDTCVSFAGAALGIGGQEAKEQYWIYLMRILDFQYLFFFLHINSTTESDFQKHFCLLRYMSIFFFKEK